MLKLLIVLPLLFFSLWCSAQEGTYNVYAAGFYNVENLFDTFDNNNTADEEFTPDGENVWTDEKYQEKLANIASVISNMGQSVCPAGVALLGVSEVENDTVLADLVSHPLIAGRNYGYIIKNSQSGRGIDVALIYDKDLFVPTDTAWYIVDIEALGSSRGTRPVMLVSGLLDGSPVHITINHWPSRSGGQKRSAKFRNLAAQVNKKIIDSLLQIDPYADIIVMGDMNDNTDDESLILHLGARNSLEDVTEHSMYNPFHKYHEKGIGTTAYRDRWSLFDQILVSPGLSLDTEGLRFFKSEIYNPGYLIQQFGRYKKYPFRTFSGDEYQHGYSDHFPVLVYLINNTED